MEKVSSTRKLVESAMLIAIATVLSLIKLFELPYGGSITLASMLPLIIIAYRYGTAWGVLCGLVHGAIQLALGAGVLSYVTGAASVIAVILLDYIVAFGVLGLAGLVRKKPQPTAFVVGALIASALRYLCHVISGCTVWAGLSIPTNAALVYSLIYNATYMLPETLVLMIVAYYLSTSLDFGGVQLKTIAKADTTVLSKTLSLIAGLILTAAALFDVVAIFSKLQNAETGEFDITAISTAPWLWIVIVTVAAAAIAVVLNIMRKRTNNN